MIDDIEQTYQNNADQEHNNINMISNDTNNPINTEIFENNETSNHEDNINNTNTENNENNEITNNNDNNIDMVLCEFSNDPMYREDLNTRICSVTVTLTHILYRASPMGELYTKQDGVYRTCKKGNRE